MANEKNNGNLPAVVQRAVAEQRMDLSQVTLMLPTQTFGEVLGIYDKLTIEAVTVDPNPKNGDVFDCGKGKLVLEKRPIMAISSAVGIVWDVRSTTILESTSTKSRAKATGAMRKPNGEMIVVTEEKTVDLEVIEEEIRLDKEEQAEKGNFTQVEDWGETDTGKRYPKSFKPWKDAAEKAAVLDREIRRAVLAYKKFKDERAMTGAKERVVRVFVAIKNSYTADELKKPLAFLRVTLDASKMLDNPTLRQAAVDRMVGSLSSVFGPGNSGEPRNVTPAPAALLAPEDPAGEASAAGEGARGTVVEEDDPFTASTPADPKDEAVQRLVEFSRDEQLPLAAHKLIQETLDDSFAPLDTLTDLVTLLEYLANPKLPSSAHDLIVGQFAQFGAVTARQDLIKRCREHLEKRAAKKAEKAAAAGKGSAA